MANRLDNLKPFSSEYQPLNNGRKKGTRNRSTIIRELLELNDNELRMHQAQINKAIELRDTNAYKAVLDSAYGAPIQQIEETQQFFDFSEFTSDEIRELLNED